MSSDVGDVDIKLAWSKMKSGDEKSLSEIFVYFYSDLYRYGIKVFDLPDLVKDTIQDVFMRIWERRETIGEVQNPRAYLISSIRRKLFSNKEARHDNLSDDLQKVENKENFSFAAAEFMEIKEISYNLKDSLVEVINTLPERQRELIFLRFYYNLRYKEIATIMEVNEQTVRNLMQRGIAKLRTQIDRQLWDGIDDIDQLLLTFFFFFNK